MLNFISKLLMLLTGWKLIGSCGANDYWENSVTGKREVIRRKGFSPVAQSWLNHETDDLYSTISEFRPIPYGGSGVISPDRARRLAENSQKKVDI